MRFSSITSEKATLWWGLEKDNGGAPVENYIIEKRETSRLNWALVK